MIEKEILYKRLSFIKYIYGEAVKQSGLTEPLCHTALLGFHDAIELFLQLATEHLNISKNNINFMEYWILLNGKMKNNELTQQETMKRLNKARVALKHYGNFPSKLSLESFKYGCKSFFEENTASVFKIEFNQISLCSLIVYPKTKEKLLLAEKAIFNERYKDSIENSALGFKNLLEEYEVTKRTAFGNIFNDTLDVSGIHDLSSIDYFENSAVNEAIQNNFEILEEKIKIIGFGIDYRSYARFKHLSPTIDTYLDGHIDLSFKVNSFEKENAEFCLNFCIDSSLMLSNNDYHIGK